MDFFEQQDRAKRNTLFLTFFFAAAVVLIIIAVYFVLAFFLIGGRSPATAETDWLATIRRLWDPAFFFWTTIGTLAIISTGTLYKMSMLSAGGKAVARMFGASQIDLQTTDPAERRLLNVVEEIAIASGLPVPEVYVLDDESINAFAAGFSNKDAIIGVTRGCMNLLSRDELQGVIAHEFSHILNGDMRLNLRLMGVLHGILVISIIGWWIFRISSQSSRSGISGAARRKGGNTLVILLIGLCLMIIGYIGVFFARLIKSAVSRQREFLADASSVQFTRNPEGIAGALKKIGGLVSGGLINHPNAEDASHLFFANGLKHAFFNLMATHPPLAERIRRIDPTFDGAFPASDTITPVAVDDEISFLQQPVQPTAPYRQSAGRSIRIEPAKAVKAVGRLDAESLRITGQWLASLPPAIRSATRDPESAEALIMAMLISRDDKIRNDQLLYIEKNIDESIYKKMLELMPALENGPPESFLPLVDLATAALRTLGMDGLKVFAGHLRHIVESDGTITLLEYMVQAMVSANIRSWTRREKDRGPSLDLKHSLPLMYTVLSTLAYYGNDNEEAASYAFAAGIKRLATKENPEILPKNECGLSQVDRALSGLSTVLPQIKKRFLDACCACVAQDGLVSISEAELLRAVAAILDCPIPPFLPTGLSHPNDSAGS